MNALATLTVDLPMPEQVPATLPRLELRVLGASHQVVLTDSSGTAISETVACLPGRPADLPGHTVEHVGAWSYTFAARTHRCSPPQFQAEVEQLLHGIESRSDALACSFPESPSAVTVVVTTAGGWRTWHTYPQDGDIVETRTEVRPL